LASSSILYETRIASSLNAHRDDGKRYVVPVDEKLTAFLDLEAAIRRVSG